MLSWASYLFGSGTTEPQPEEVAPEPAPMEVTKPEPGQDWVVVDYAGTCKFGASLTLSQLVATFVVC